MEKPPFAAASPMAFARFIGLVGNADRHFAVFPHVFEISTVVVCAEGVNTIYRMASCFVWNINGHSMALTLGFVYVSVGFLVYRFHMW